MFQILFRYYSDRSRHFRYLQYFSDLSEPFRSFLTDLSDFFVPDIFSPDIFIPRKVPVGVPGRMWIAGPTLAIGYLNMPERTSERFVPDPFAAAAGKEERMYDTGDRCRYLPSGSIEVIGRCDFMVKVGPLAKIRLRMKKTLGCFAKNSVGLGWGSCSLLLI